MWVRYLSISVYCNLKLFTALCITPTCLKTLFRLRSETLHLGTLYWKLFFLQFHYSIEQDRKYIVSNEWYVRDLNNKSQTFYQWSTEGYCATETRFWYLESRSNFSIGIRAETFFLISNFLMFFCLLGDVNFKGLKLNIDLRK